MKKVLLASDLKSLFPEEGEIGSFLDRADIKLHTAATNDEMLKVHRKVGADLIVTQLDMPGIKTEEFFDLIRQNDELRDVSTIIVCKDTLAHRERCKRCSANSVFTIPVDTTLLHFKMQQFLSIAPRGAYRAPLAVAIQGSFKNSPLPFWTKNISATGMLIKSQEPLLKGDGIFFSFFLHDGTHACGYGEIARVVQLPAPDSFLYGIKFTNVEASVRTAIKTAVMKMRL